MKTKKKCCDGSLTSAPLLLALNTAAVVALGLESVGLKLGFLQRVLDGGAELVRGRVVESPVKRVCLVYVL